MRLSCHAQSIAQPRASVQHATRTLLPPHRAMCKARAMPKPLPDLIGAREVCEWADIDRATLTRHVQLGKITPAMRAGASKNSPMLFNRADVAVYIAKIKPERVA